MWSVQQASFGASATLCARWRLSVFGKKLFEHLVEGGVEIGVYIVLAVIDAASDVFDFFVTYLGQRTDEFQQLSKGGRSRSVELFVVERVSVVV